MALPNAQARVDESSVDLDNVIPLTGTQSQGHEAEPGFASMPARLPWLLMLACGLAVLLVLAAEFSRWTGASQQAVAPEPIDAGLPPAVRFTELSTSLLPIPEGMPSAHASSLAALSGNELLAFWWAGSRESGPDVKVFSSQWSDGKWAPPKVVASRESLGAALGFGVRRIGNPVAWTARDGNVNLFVVATGLGGWAASRVVHLVSDDRGASFKVKRVLPLSPLFNTSVLVRSTAVGLADGGWWLPAYFELGIKYPIMIAFDNAGEPRWLSRIGERTASLQPAVVPASGNKVHAWMRDAGHERKIQHAVSDDGGISWKDMPSLDLKNHDSSVAALRLSNGSFAMLHNHVEDGQSFRNVLRLSISSDASAWRHVVDIARGDAHEEFSYPTLQQIGNELHVSYTSRRTAIAHHVFRIDYEEGAK